MKYTAFRQLQNKENQNELNIAYLAEDLGNIRQIKASREDRKAGRVYHQEDGLEYLRQHIQKHEFETEG